MYEASLFYKAPGILNYPLQVIYLQYNEYQGAANIKKLIERLGLLHLRKGEATKASKYSTREYLFMLMVDSLQDGWILKNPVWLV